MTIQEAIRTHKPMRRKGWGSYRGIWHLLSIDGTWIEVARPPKKKNKKYDFGPRLEDILADDWEIKEEKEKPDLPFKIRRKKTH